MWAKVQKFEGMNQNLMTISNPAGTSACSLEYTSCNYFSS